MNNDVERDFQEFFKSIHLNRMKNEEIKYKQNQFRIESIVDSFDRYDRLENEVFSGFNSDTKISAFGGLRIWELTAIAFFALLVIAILIFLIKKFIQQRNKSDSQRGKSFESFNTLLTDH